MKPHTIHAKSPRNSQSLPQLLGYFYVQDIPGAALSSAICLTMDPLTLKKKFILGATTDGVGSHSWLVCVSPEKTCWLCVRSLRSATPHFSPLFSRGERALSVIVSEPTQPLMLSHASSRGLLSPAYLALSRFLRTPFSITCPSRFSCYRTSLSQLSPNVYTSPNVYRQNNVSITVRVHRCRYLRNKQLSYFK